jgi:hypothetical protein
MLDNDLINWILCYFSVSQNCNDYLIDGRKLGDSAAYGDTDNLPCEMHVVSYDLPMCGPTEWKVYMKWMCVMWDQFHTSIFCKVHQLWGVSGRLCALVIRVMIVSDKSNLKNGTYTYKHVYLCVWQSIDLYFRVFIRINVFIYAYFHDYL